MKHLKTIQKLQNIPGTLIKVANSLAWSGIMGHINNAGTTWDRPERTGYMASYASLVANFDLQAAFDLASTVQEDELVSDETVAELAKLSGMSKKDVRNSFVEDQMRNADRALRNKDKLEDKKLVKEIKTLTSKVLDPKGLTPEDDEFILEKIHSAIQKRIESLVGMCRTPSGRRIALPEIQALNEAGLN